MTMWLNVWGRNQTWEWGITHESTSLYDRECSACQMKKTSWKATFDAEWMTLTSSPASSIACCFITNSSTPPSPSPSLFPAPFHLWSHHLLPTLSPLCQARKRPTSLLTLPIQTFPTWFCQRLDLLEIPSRELSYCDLSWKHLSLLLPVFCLHIYIYISFSIAISIPPSPLFLQCLPIALISGTIIWSFLPLDRNTQRLIEKHHQGTRPGAFVHHRACPGVNCYGVLVLASPVSPYTS